MKRTTHHFFLACITFVCATYGAQTLAASLELDDCDVLIGHKQAADYKAWKAGALKAAAQNDLDALRELAAESNNRLVCQQEALTGDSGWAITEETSDGVSQTTQTAGIPNIRKQPAAFAALKDAVRYNHEVGRVDPGYRALSASLVARYASDLPEAVDDAYADAMGAYEFDCVLKRKFGRRLQDAACADDRQTLAQLRTKVSAEKRAVLDEAARTWARELKVNAR